MIGTIAVACIGAIAVIQGGFGLGEKAKKTVGEGAKLKKKFQKEIAHPSTVLTTKNNEMKFKFSLYPHQACTSCG